MKKSNREKISKMKKNNKEKISKMKKIRMLLTKIQRIQTRKKSKILNRNNNKKNRKDQCKTSHSNN